MKSEISLYAAALLVASLHAQTPARPESDTQGFRFKSGVELINVTATVSDVNGRFVPGLRQEDFIVYEDDQPMTVTHFNAERVPVSLGIALDTSGSMAGRPIADAKVAMNSFLQSLGAQDQAAVLTFAVDVRVEQTLTSDKAVLIAALPKNGTWDTFLMVGVVVTDTCTLWRPAW